MIKSMVVFRKDLTMSALDGLIGARPGRGGVDRVGAVVTSTG